MDNDDIDDFVDDLADNYLAKKESEKKISEAVERILDGTPLYCRPDSEVVFHWGKPGVGFGTATFYYSDHEFGVMKLYCDNETMSKAFIKEMLCQMVDEAEFED